MTTLQQRTWQACVPGAIMPALYMFCGLSAGMAGLLVSSNVASADANNAGQLLELDAILAVTPRWQPRWRAEASASPAVWSVR